MTASAASEELELIAQGAEGVWACIIAPGSHLNMLLCGTLLAQCV